MDISLREVLSVLSGEHERQYSRAGNEGLQRFHNHGQGPYQQLTFSWLTAAPSLHFHIEYMMLGRRSNDHSFNLREPSVPALVKAYIVSFPDRDAQQVVSKQRRRRTSKQQIVLTDVCSLTQTTISIYQSNNKNI